MTTTNHQVTITPTTVTKKAGSWPRAKEALLHQSEVLAAMGRKHSYSNGVLSEPNLGVPITPSSQSAQKLLEAATELHHLKVLSLPMEDEELVEWRLRNATGESEAAARLLIRELGGSVTPPKGEVLVHGDLNLGNAVVDEAGSIHLIDLESATYSIPQWDEATLLLSYFIRGAEEVVNIERTPTIDDCLRRKLAISTSWAAWNLGLEGVLERRRVAERLKLLQ